MESRPAFVAAQDLEPFLPAVVDAASSIDKTHSCVEKCLGFRPKMRVKFYGLG